MEINNRIDELLRAKNGGNMSELARFCDVTPQAVQQWIEGVTTPRGKRLQKIAEFFEIPEAELVYGPTMSLTPWGPKITSQAKQNYSEPSLADIRKAFDKLKDPAQRKAIVAMLQAFGVLGGDES